MPYLIYLTSSIPHYPPTHQLTTHYDYIECGTVVCSIATRVTWVPGVPSSCPPIRPVAVRRVRPQSSAAGWQVVGVGGVHCWVEGVQGAFTCHEHFGAGLADNCLAVGAPPCASIWSLLAETTFKQSHSRRHWHCGHHGLSLFVAELCQ